MMENRIFTLCRMITWVVFLRMFWILSAAYRWREEDPFHFCCSRVIGLDMTENRIFTLCRTITWVVFLRMFWNFISSLPVKRGGSLSFLTIFTFAVPELLDLLYFVWSLGVIYKWFFKYSSITMTINNDILSFY
jgi:hypothetical protein